MKRSTKPSPKSVKRRAARGRDAVIVGAGFSLLGLLLFLVVIPQLYADLRIARNANEAGHAEFAVAPIGDDVVVYGVLEGNPEVEGSAVLMVQEELRHDTSDSQSDWDWEEIQRDIPLLIMDLDGSAILLVTDQGPVNLRGERHEMLAAVAGTGLTDTFPYQDQRIAAGSTRTFSMRNGDPVTALGTKISENEIATRELFGGDPQGLAAELAQGATTFTLAAWCLGFAGIVILVIGFGAIRTGRF